MYKNHLVNALEIIFREKNLIGFWDSKENKITERLYHDKNWNWKYVEIPQNRYGLFCLSCILMAENYNKINIDIYRNKVKSYLDTIQNNINNYKISDLTYGALLALILGIKLGYLSDNITSKLESILVKSIKLSKELKDNQNFLILIPAFFYLTINNSKEVRENLINLTKYILDSVDKKGLFNTGDLRYCYHQRIMYTIWGLIHASNLCYEKEIYTLVKNLFFYILEHRRQKSIDDAFIWHPKFYFVKNRVKFLPIPIFNYKSSRYLFECHQTFFVNAVYFFNERFGEKIFINEAFNALEWIFGKNRMQKDLTKITKISIPARIMTFDGNLFIKNENYKGSYEIGSYILALSFLINKYG